MKFKNIFLPFIVVGLEMAAKESRQMAEYHRQMAMEEP